MTAALAIALPSSAVAAGEAGAALSRGITALHCFEYEDANEAFGQARRLDPGLVMAYWGEAMTYHQTLWRNENVAAAREALARLAPTAAARAAKAGDAKTRGYLAAADALFGDGDAASRRLRYADAMARLQAAYPDDPDAAAFYALALLGTMTRSLIGTADAHEGHSQALAGSEMQTRVSAILDRVLKTHPDHPGALHYLLHNDDDPGHARFALDAARAFAKLAPDSSHARHMPAHVFLQLGLWQDAAASDRDAFAASDAWVARKRLGPALRNYHALAWLQYELLQLGRYGEAKATLDQLAPLVKAGGDVTLLSDLSSMRARYVIETASWDVMARETNFGNANELFAIAISAARSGNAELAGRAVNGLAERARDPREGDLRPAVAIMEREAAAVAALMRGAKDEAVSILRAAAESEAQLPAPLGLPEPIKPAPELLGEVLIEIGRPAEAIAPFEAALARYANRSLSMNGLARARAAIAPPPAPSSRAPWLAAAALAAAVAITIAAAIARGKKKRGPVARAPQKKRVR